MPSTTQTAVNKIRTRNFQSTSPDYIQFFLENDANDVYETKFNNNKKRNFSELQLTEVLNTLLKSQSLIYVSSGKSYDLNKLFYQKTDCCIRHVKLLPLKMNLRLFIL